jgi:HSP90 family molecular chaperone
LAVIVSAACLCLANVRVVFLFAFRAGKTIVDAGKEASQDLSEEERQAKQAHNEETEAFRHWMKDALGDKITRVEASSRLVDSPATLVQSEYGVSPSMQKYLRAQVRSSVY